MLFYMAFPLLFSGCAFVFTLPPVEKIQEYRGENHPMVVDRKAAKLYEFPDSQTRILKLLPKGAVVTALAEAGSNGKVAYYKLRTRSDAEGWCKRWDVDPITSDLADLLVLRDKQSFEQSLLDKIFSAARAHIKAEGIRPLSDIEAIQVTEEIAAASGSNVDIGVRALMVGKLIGIDRFQVDMIVNLFIDVNQDHLSHSITEVNRVTVTENKKVKGLTLEQQISLLKIVAPILGIFP